MAELNWHDAIEKLTRTHHVTVPTDDGPVFLEQPGLIQQLRDEMFGGTDKGAASGNKTKLPLNAPAVDLYTLIDRQVSEVWATVTGLVPGVDTTESLLVAWAVAVGEDAPVLYSTPETLTDADKRSTVIWLRNQTNALTLLRKWIQQIEDLFNPPRTADILAACITCGVRDMWKTVDGVQVRSSAFVFVRDRITGDSTEARCLACGQSWPPTMFLFLANAITTNESAEDTQSIGVDK